MLTGVKHTILTHVIALRATVGAARKPASKAYVCPTLHTEGGVQYWTAICHTMLACYCLSMVTLSCSSIGMFALCNNTCMHSCIACSGWAQTQAYPTNLSHVRQILTNCLNCDIQTAANEGPWRSATSCADFPGSHLLLLLWSVSYALIQHSWPAAHSAQQLSVQTDTATATYIIRPPTSMHFAGHLHLLQRLHSQSRLRASDSCEWTFWHCVTSCIDH